MFIETLKKSWLVVDLWVPQGPGACIGSLAARQDSWNFARFNGYPSSDRKRQLTQRWVGVSRFAAHVFKHYNGRSGGQWAIWPHTRLLKSRVLCETFLSGDSPPPAPLPPVKCCKPYGANGKSKVKRSKGSKGWRLSVSWWKIQPRVDRMCKRWQKSTAGKSENWFSLPTSLWRSVVFGECMDFSANCNQMKGE